MAFDDTKTDSTDDVLAADWNAMVTDQKTRGVMNTPEEKAGSDCTGSDGATGRVLTISNTVTTSGGVILTFVEGLLIEPSKLTVTHAASGTTIEFADKIWNSDEIVVIYFTTE